MDSFIQSDFSGGMNLFSDDINIQDTEYGLAYNIRNRNTGLTPTKLPVEDESAPSGLKQGIYGFDKYLIMFVGGFAYYKNIVTDSAWTLIANFRMDPYVDKYCVQAIPASVNNYKRALINSDQISGNPNTNRINLIQISTTASISGLVVQDGTSQPWIIFQDGTANRLQSYDEWRFDTNNDQREYVPVMKQMAYINGILFGISPDGKSIYRSVSGRPLDFVVNVDTNGNKGGDATTTAYSVGNIPVQCLKALPTGELMAATAKTIFMLTLDYSRTLFDEPSFSINTSISAGIVNQDSFIDELRPDGVRIYYFIDLDGVRMFSADIRDDRNEGRNTIFTRYISGALRSKQTISTLIAFDNYVYFSLGTKYAVNNLIGLYDNLSQHWVCLDNFNIDTIKQFSVADQSDNPTLYAITNGKVYKMQSGLPAQAQVSFKSRCYGNATQVKTESLKSIFLGGSLIGTVSAVNYENGYIGATIKERLLGLPVENIRFNFQKQSSQVWKVTPNLTWQTDARLAVLQLDVFGQTQPTSIQQQSRNYAA